REGDEADDGGHRNADHDARQPAEDDVALVGRGILDFSQTTRREPTACLYPLTRAQLRHLSDYVGVDGPRLESPSAERLVGGRSVRRNAGGLFAPPAPAAPGQ